MKRLLILGALVPLLAHAQMYKCVDERGVTHYTERPQPGCKGKEVDIRGQPPIGEGGVQERSRDTARDDAEFRRRQAAQEEREAREKKARQLQCSRMRNELNGLSNSRRVVTGYTDKGERSYMDDATRDRRVAELKDRLRGCP